MISIDKPTGNYPSFYKAYMDNVPEDGILVNHLREIINETRSLIASLTEEQLLFRYQANKWTIKDILLHLADCERVIIYRAMRIARADQTNLPGFDENLFVINAGANKRDIEGIVNELEQCRAASIAFIESLDHSMLGRLGTANHFELSVRLLVNHLYGHHRHHLNIIKERYLPLMKSS